MDFVCFNKTQILIEEAWDLCFFGGACVSNNQSYECRCLDGYEADKTLFLNTRNCALPSFALEVVFGCFLFIWLIVGYVYAKFMWHSNSPGLRRIKIVTNVLHISLFVYMLGTMLTHTGGVFLLFFGTTYLLCLIFLLCEVSLKMLQLRHMTTTKVKQAQKRFLQSVPFSFSVIVGLAILALVHTTSKDADIFIIAWFLTTYFIVDVYIICLYELTQAILHILDSSNAVDEVAKPRLQLKLKRMRLMYVIFGVVATTISIIVATFKLTVGSLPFSWIICLVPIASYGAIVPLIVVHTHSKATSVSLHSSKS